MLPGTSGTGVWLSMDFESDGKPETYFDHVIGAASIAAFQRHQDTLLLSAEALPESSLIDFKSFAQEYPEKLAPLIQKLRPEFREIFIEYYLLDKSQSFIGKTHGQIQTRVWQNLRIIEQTIGAYILLGLNPGQEILQPILVHAGLETTPYGSLTQMILTYATSQSYAVVANQVNAPAPAIRKIFRPTIATLLESKNVKAVAVGAYLRSLTHQASLTGVGLSKRCIARTRRVKTLRFIAPPAENSPLISFGPVSTLGNTPWCMLEISSEHRMDQLRPALKTSGKRIFRKKAAQIFAPLNSEGELEFGYMFARSASTALVRTLTRIRGITEMATLCNDEGTFIRAVTVPHADVQKIIDAHNIQPTTNIQGGDFVEILAGPASCYCGTVIGGLADKIIVEVNFPTGRHFLVTADNTSVKLIPGVPPADRKFWGLRLP
jgi:hypothetical protein